MKGFTNYVRTLKWTPLPLGVGFALIACQRYKHIRKRQELQLYSNEPPCLATPLEASMYKMLPLRHFSRAWGFVNDIHLPIWCRKAVLSSYVNTFGCNMKEAEEENILEYKCLSSLFRRAIKPSVRPIDEAAALTSPVDGTVLAAGPVKCGTLHQVKGVQYSIRKFLGPNAWKLEQRATETSKDIDECYHESCLSDPKNSSLYQVVLYLAPGDYHRFHSPTNWNVEFRRHFPGELLSVNPGFAAWLPNLFVLNERVAYIGKWKGGFCSMTAVGATNVGSIKVYSDDDLQTNQRKWSSENFFDKKFKQLALKKGELFGEFNLGSTVVLIVELPKDKTIIDCEIGKKIKMGEPLITLKSELPEKTVC